MNSNNNQSRQGSHGCISTQTVNMSAACPSRPFLKKFLCRLHPFVGGYLREGPAHALCFIQHKSPNQSSSNLSKKLLFLVLILSKNLCFSNCSTEQGGQRAVFQNPTCFGKHTHLLIKQKGNSFSLPHECTRV